MVRRQLTPSRRYEASEDGPPGHRKVWWTFPIVVRLRNVRPAGPTAAGIYSDQQEQQLGSLKSVIISLAKLRYPGEEQNSLCCKHKLRLIFSLFTIGSFLRVQAMCLSPVSCSLAREKITEQVCKALRVH
ncbi:hypothetical protein CBL_00206 [Carabus blaptoides fortunei]